MGVDMRRIVQEDGTGCGLACIAMLAGKKYKTIRKTAKKELSDSAAHPHGFGYRRRYYTTNSDVRKLAARYGLCVGRKVKFERQIRHRKRKISSSFNAYMIEKRLNSHAIVATHRKSNGYWHFVVWDNDKGQILDPRKKPPDTIYPWYYLRVR